MAKQTENTDREGKDDRQLLLQIHLAEYQAITTRITYWITLQYSTAPIVGGVLAVLAGTGKLFPPVVDIWAVSIIIEIGIGAYYYTIYEMMNNARYLECELAPKLRSMIPKGIFLGYERYRKGNHVYSPAGIFLMTLPCVVIPLVALLLHWRLWPPLSWLGDLTGGLLCGGIGVLDIFIARKSAKMQRELWSCASTESSKR